jgi:phosphoenolpyruvate carboxykinase (ATP)
MTSLELGTLYRDLKTLGFQNKPALFYNLSPAELLEHAAQSREGLFTDSGSFMVDTSPYTGRSPKDKYFVDHNNPDLWLGEDGHKMSPEDMTQIKSKVLNYLEGQTLFVRDVYVGAHPDFRVPIRVITDTAWQNLAACNLFIARNESIPFPDPAFTLLVATGFEAVPEIDHTRSKPFIILDLENKLVLIGASKYAGEIKKSVFTLMNYLMPKRNVLSLHCSANQGKGGDVALFFGLSGTGKTTLSSDQNRDLIGDDEHGWSDEGIFNFEGGCYAKTIRLNAAYEPLVWSAIHQFQAILENVPLDEKRHPDFNDNSITENTRSAYPLRFIPNHVEKGFGGHPKHIFLLTADAFGVLPPLARLSTDQALYYFISGFTSKLAGTERGLGQEPQATFSACFGAPFLPLHPGVYARLLGERLKKHATRVWLLNTGWTGGGYGVGERISLPYTRSLINAVLRNSLNNVPTFHHDVFNLDIPKCVEDIPGELLDPKNGWVDKELYTQTALKLAQLFRENFEHYADLMPESVRASGPR